MLIRSEILEQLDIGENKRLVETLKNSKEYYKYFVENVLGDDPLSIEYKAKIRNIDQTIRVLDSMRFEKMKKQKEQNKENKHEKRN